MARLILLDSGPLGLIVRALGKPQVVRGVTWLNAVMATGATVIIPEIAHYEVRCELLRIRAVGSPRRLHYALDPSSGFRHLTLSTDAMVKAAEFPFSLLFSTSRCRGLRGTAPVPLFAQGIVSIRWMNPGPRAVAKLAFDRPGLVQRLLCRGLAANPRAHDAEARPLSI